MPWAGSPYGVAVDGSGNVYVAESEISQIAELPRAFVPGGSVSEGAAAGGDALPPVLSSIQSLTGVFAPTSDESWLTIGSVSGGVINFSFARNTGPIRTAHITVLGQQITVTQAGAPPGNLGVFNGGYWYRDVNGDGVWDSGDGSPLAFGPAGATPVVGDWDGSGNTELGYYLNGTWCLQTASGVETFTFGFTGSNVFPVVGDWNGGGKTEVGVYCNGAWFRDVDGSHTWDATNQSMLAYLGWNDGGTNSVIPVPGDWAGDGKTEMGVYCKGVWFLDSTDSNQWDGGYSYWGWSSSTLVPVAGNWDGGTKSQFGVYTQGVWFRDMDGTHQWDAANQAAVAYFGWAGRSPWWATGTTTRAPRRGHRRLPQRSRLRHGSKRRCNPRSRRHPPAAERRKRWEVRSHWFRARVTADRPIRPLAGTRPSPRCRSRQDSWQSIRRRSIGSISPRSSRPRWGPVSYWGSETRLN